MTMELRQIQYFIETARREHMTEAAEALHVAQSAVSRQINHLEEELGVKLFIREGRSVRLTPIGKRFLEQMEQAMKLIDNAKREIEEYLDPERGTIHIGFPSSLANYTLPTIISTFREKYPDVKFKLNQGSYTQLTERVIEGTIDLALLGPLPQDKRLKGEVLFSEKMVLLLPKHHPLSSKKRVHLRELYNEPFISFPKNFVLREEIVDVCRQNGFEPNVPFEGEEIYTIKGLVSAGLGITLLPESSFVDGIPRSTVLIPKIEPEVRRTVGIITPANRELLPTEKIFYQFIIDFFKMINRYQD